MDLADPELLVSPFAGVEFYPNGKSLESNSRHDFMVRNSAPTSGMSPGSMSEKNRDGACSR